jgi:hypothetical protein
MKFFAGTKVDPSKTRDQMERLLTKAGASSFAYLNTAERCAVAFQAEGRYLRFVVPIPHIEAIDGRGHQRTPAQMSAALDRATAQLWRALLLGVRAKLVSVAAHLETFDEAFAANVVGRDGLTLIEHVRAAGNPALLPSVNRGEAA